MTMRFHPERRQHCRRNTMGQLCIAMGSVFAICNAAVRAEKIQTFRLHPTSELGVEVDSRNDWRRLAGSWLQNNALYATLPKETDSTDVSHDVKDFHAHRHLSRYEREYRSKHAIDIAFDGVYAEANHTTERLLKAREDPYHIAPLNQGYGTHYVNLWVGTPTPQRKTVIVDTGSHYTAFPCSGCTRCGEGHHTDPFFDPEQSETFRPLECSECIRGATCRNGRCSFSQSYTEGSSWEAYLAEDTLFCGGNDILDAADPLNQQFAIPFMFGCQTTESGLFVTQLADGIMGMSAHESTLPKKLYDMGKIEHNMFTMCFSRKLGTSLRGVSAGVMTMGGVDERMNKSPMVYAKNMATLGWYTVFVRNVYMQSSDGDGSGKGSITRIPIDISAVNSGKGVIVDSGTTDTYLHKKLAKSFGKIWKDVTGKDYHHRPVSLTEEQLHQLPTIIVQCAGAYVLPSEQIGNNTDLLAATLDPSAPNDVLIAIPPTSYMEYSPVAKLYTSRIYFTESQGGVLGANAMIDHNVLFDWEHGRVGFAKSNCEHPDDRETMEAVAAENDVPDPTNCALAKETLSQSCLESVDLEQCEDHPNRVLRGIEIWSMVVVEEGSVDGISCEKAASIQSGKKKIKESRITCRDGTCTDIGQCEIKCSDVAKTKQPKALAEPNDSKEMCSSAWSACDSSCTQTRVISELWTDGLCHEKERESRQCHTGACVKSHPCNVPFVIRAEIGLRGRKPWSYKTDYSIAKALMLAIERETLTSRNSLTLGDIRVVSKTPWVTSNTTRNWDHVVIGTKGLVDISIVNVKGSPDSDPNAMSEKSSLVAMAKGFRRRSTQGEKVPQCNDSELFSLAKHALNVKEVILNSPFLLTQLETAVGFEAAEIISISVSSQVKKDDEVIPLGSFSAGFHTHRLRQYAHHNPFIAIIFFLSISFLVFGICSAFEWAIAVAMKRTTFLSQDKTSDTTLSIETNHSQHSQYSDESLMEQLVSSATASPNDSFNFDSDREDDMLERFFNVATGTPPRKLKEDADTPLRIPSFEQTHSLDESMDRSFSRGASPRKRIVSLQDVESDLEKARAKLERHV